MQKVIYEAHEDDGDGNLKVEKVTIESSNPESTLFCTCGSETRECRHVMAAILANADGPYLFDQIQILTGETNLEIPMSIREGIYIRVTVELPDRDHFPNRGRVHITSRDLVQTNYFSENQRATLGSISKGEGRSAIRFMILSAMDRAFLATGIINEAGKCCTSPRHSMLEEQQFREFAKTPEFLWVWRYRTFLNGGTCPPCKKRRERAMSEYEGMADYTPRTSPANYRPDLSSLVPDWTAD